VEKDVIIIGAGASGLVCASEAGKRGRSVIVADHAPRIGSKIRISGGGRCNFTNLHVSADHYLSQNPHFCKSALSRFRPEDFISLLKRHTISFHEKEAGQLFCDSTSTEVIRMLRTECEEAGAELLLGCSVKGIEKDRMFIVSTDKGTLEAGALVVATGGVSWPNIGATDLGLRIARQFGHTILPHKPGLVPLTLSRKEQEMFGDLSGVSLDAEVTCNTISFRGKVLFTHRGLSGPAILQISSHWNKGDILLINLLPDRDAYDLFLTNRSSRKEMQNLLSRYLPSRFIQTWCRHYLQTKPICQFTEKELKEASEKIHAWGVRPSGTEGYKAAEVMVGGIDTQEVSSKTMESKKVPGLYFIGEVLDVTGQLGGYNLHWAWASGHAAGQYV
jgi:predicted Rossmann fold flavoprotein